MFCLNKSFDSFTVLSSVIHTVVPKQFSVQCLHNNSGQIMLQTRVKRWRSWSQTIFTHQTCIHFSLLVSGAKHFVVQFQNDVFELVPSIADSVIDDWNVDFLKQVCPSFSCSRTQRNTLKQLEIFVNVSSHENKSMGVYKPGKCGRN